MSFFTGVVGAAKGIQPTFRQDFTKSEVLDPRITFSRNSIATRFNSAGIQEVLAANQPRFDHDSVTLQPNGILIEESRTNLLNNSNDFANQTYWTRNTIDVTPGATTSLDGTINASAIISTIDDGTIKSHRIGKSTDIVSGTTYTLSVHLKVGTYNFFHFRVSNGTSYNTAAFNLSTGAVTFMASGHSGKVTFLSNGWVKAEVTFTATSTATVIQYMGFSPTAQTVTGSPVWIGSNNIDGYCYGAQFEPGSYSTSFTPTTTTAAVTRANDNARIIGSNLSSFYNQTEGT